MPRGLFYFRQQRKPFTPLFQPAGLGMLNKNDRVGSLRELVDRETHFSR
jgi:hypothetical protein